MEPLPYNVGFRGVSMEGSSQELAGVLLLVSMRREGLGKER